MNDMLWLYLLTRLDAFKMFWIAIAVALAVVAFFSVVFTLGDDDSETSKAGIKRATKAAVAAIICFGICVLIPSTNSALFIIGGATVLDAARSEPAKRIAGKSVEFIERFLDEQLKKNKKE